METTNGKDIIIAVCDTPMGRKYPFLYINGETQDPQAHCKQFAEAVKWNLVDVIVTGLKAPHCFDSAEELIARFVKNV